MGQNSKWKEFGGKKTPRGFKGVLEVFNPKGP